VLVLCNADYYGHTTAGHQSQVNDACNHLPRIDVPYPIVDSTGSHVQNLAYFDKEIAKCFDKCKRVLQIKSFAWKYEKACNLHADSKTYREFFKIRKHAPKFPDFAPLRERVERIENPDPIRDAAKLRARASSKIRQQAKITQDKAEVMAKWRSGGLNYLGYRAYDMPVMLRMRGEDIVQTSKGAECPLSHAKQIWDIIKDVCVLGVPYAKNSFRYGPIMHVGHYVIDEIDIAGNLKAGCHQIDYAEMERLAVSLGWEPMHHVSELNEGRI
jgi:hypothetical protein